MEHSRLPLKRFKHLIVQNNGGWIKIIRPLSENVHLNINYFTHISVSVAMDNVHLNINYFTHISVSVAMDKMRQNEHTQ